MFKSRRVNPLFTHMYNLDNNTTINYSTYVLQGY